MLLHKMWRWTYNKMSIYRIWHIQVKQIHVVFPYKNNWGISKYQQWCLVVQYLQWKSATKRHWNPEKVWRCSNHCQWNHKVNVWSCRNLCICTIESSHHQNIQLCWVLCSQMISSVIAEWWWNCHASSSHTSHGSRSCHPAPCLRGFWITAWKSRGSVQAREDS